MLAFACSKCGKTLEIPQLLTDERTRCSHCGELVAVPRASTACGDSYAATIALDLRRGGGQDNPPSPPPTKADGPFDFLTPPQEPGELGRLGPYRVLKILGSGGMGVVFLAEDMHLQRPVALKRLLPTLAATAQARQRFLREARAAAAIEHEHIVVIYQVGEDRGIPYLAMQFLQGESLEDRIRREGKLPVAEVLRLGREIAEGLAAAHSRGLIHRDIKPANIWLDGSRARVKLLDFGLARAVAETQVTQQGTIVGTPAYMAPEQASGQPVDARCDLFSLGCVLYQISTGKPPFEGPTTISLLLAVANVQPSPPRQLNQDLPGVLSDLLLHLLAKDPAQRPPSARAVVETITAIQQLPQEPAGTGSGQPSAVNTQPQVRSVTQTWQAAKTEVADAVSPPARSATPSGLNLPRRRWPILAGAAAVLLLAGVGLMLLFLNRSSNQQRPDDPGLSGPAAGPGQGAVEIGIAYGTEKKKWLTSAVQQFGQTPEGKHITINLIPMGSQEGGQAIWKDEDQRIQVWAPASSLYRDTLVKRWQKKHAGNPILKEETLALTPVVFVLWEDRYRAFVKKYGNVSFTTVGQALREEGGWGAIGGQPDWGPFKFSHTDPAKSNSGLMTLVVMAAEFHHKTRRLTAQDVADSGFQTWVREFEKAIPQLSHSTGALMEDMVRRGPASYDGLFVYENVVIDYFKAAQGRWGKLHVAYPPHNLWSDNPYYLLDVPWSSPAQRQAAEAFLRFLMSEPLQRQALAHGFRPGDVNVPVKDIPDSPFLLYQEAGLHVDLQDFIETPGDEVIENLLRFWDKARERKEGRGREWRGTGMQVAGFSSVGGGKPPVDGRAER